MKASIIINNFNYARFLRTAINSALSQTYPDIELIIVDDGSTDNSRDIIKEYAERAVIVMKTNGGQGSAFNEGFKKSSGDVIFYLDSDDGMDADTVKTVMSYFMDPTLSKVHWPLRLVDDLGVSSGQPTPNKELPEGSLINEVLKYGPNAYLSPPTSGNAWSRKFLEKVLPMPADDFKISADNYLCMLAPLYGSIKAIQKPTGFYRFHGENNFRGKNLSPEFLKSKVDRFEASCIILADHLRALGMTAEIESWRKESWHIKLHTAANEILTLVPEKAAFILADGDQWQASDKVANRTVIPFLEKDGKYWGYPSSEEEAIEEIQRQINAGAGYLFFAWPLFWFKKHFEPVFEYLNTRHQQVINNERLLGYKLHRLS